MVLSMRTNISMAVLFIVPGWSNDMKVYTSSEHTSTRVRIYSGCL